jgi:hypothetical protein
LLADLQSRATALVGGGGGGGALVCRLRDLTSFFCGVVVVGVVAVVGFVVFQLFCPRSAAARARMVIMPGGGRKAERRVQRMRLVVRERPSKARAAMGGCREAQ